VRTTFCNLGVILAVTFSLALGCSSRPVNVNPKTNVAVSEIDHSKEQLSSRLLLSLIPQVVAGIEATSREEDPGTIGDSRFTGATVDYGPIHDNLASEMCATLSLYDYTGGRAQRSLVGFPQSMAGIKNTASDEGWGTVRRMVIIRGYPVYTIYRQKTGSGWAQSAIDDRVFIAFRVAYMNEETFKLSLDAIPFEAIREALCTR
jgi:hypothetical protein